MADAGYSGTPQLKKLGLAPGVVWDIAGAPEGWDFDSAPDAGDRAPASGHLDVVVAFVRSAAEVVPTIGRWEDRIFPDWSGLKLVWRREHRG